VANDLIIKTIFKAIDRISGPVKRMSSGVSKFSRNAARSMGQVNRITGKLSKTISRGVTRGLKLATVGVVALGAALWKVVSIGADFEKTLTSAGTKFGRGIVEGTDAYKALEDAARKTGATTEFTASQSALALKELGAAGFSLTEAITLLPNAINLATAAEVEVGDAAKLAAGSLGALGLNIGSAEEKTAQLARVMDVMKMSSDSASQTLEDVAEAIKTGGNTAVQYKQDIEQMNSAIVAMARVQIVGSEAGIAYRNIYTRLVDPVGRAKKALRDMKIDVEDSKGNMRSLTAIVGDFSAATDKMGTRKKGQALFRVFGARPIAAFGAMLNLGTEELRRIEAASYDAEGGILAASEAMRNTMSGSIDSLKSAVESVIISLFKLDDSGIKGVIDAMTGWVRANEKLIVQKIGDTITELKENFDDLVKSAKYIGAVVGTVWLLTSAIRVASGAMTLFNLVAAANPLALAVTAAIISIGFLVATIVANWEDIKITTGWLVDDIIDSFLGLGSWFVDVWINGIVAGFDWLVLYFKTLFTDPIEGIKMGFEGVLNVISTAILKIGELMRMIPGVGMAMGAIDWVVGNDREASKNYIPPGKIPVPKVAPPAIPNGAEYYRGRDGADGASTPQVQSPAARAAAIERSETKTTREGRLTILNESGRETSYAGDDLLDMGISMQPTGTF